MVFKARRLDEFTKGVGIDWKEKSPKTQVRMMRLKLQKKQRKSIQRDKRKTRGVWQWGVMWRRGFTVERSVLLRERSPELAIRVRNVESSVLLTWWLAEQ